MATGDGLCMETLFYGWPGPGKKANMFSSSFTIESKGTNVFSQENPLGLVGLDYLEFTTNKKKGPLHELFLTFGLKPVSWKQEAEQESLLFSHQDVHFLLTSHREAANSHSQRYFQQHGEGVSTMAFRVQDAGHALEEAKRRGAKEVLPLKTTQTPAGPLRWGGIQGFGDVWNLFVERPRSAHDFFPGYTPYPNAQQEQRSLSSPCLRIDHLTNNVPKGELEKWVAFYQQIFGMKVTRYFDIKGMKTGLESKVVQTPNGQVIIPINEPDTDHSKSQIQEFLDVHKGPGVQHIALTTTNILSTVEELKKRGVEFLSVPSTYYELLAGRGIHPTESLEDLSAQKILLDGDEEGYLLQIFSKNVVGASFFEIIQRKNHHGFGEGNFQALFDAIERDQMQRGYLT
jgi:4-hydroxyphenylpyruvate dioxygenase